ncbi:MAG: APC family permease, partial [Evtepia sp.]
MSNKVEKTSGIGAFDFFCIGFGAIVGVGWAVSINRWMANCGGPIPAAVGYILALVMMIPIALCYCELVPMLPVAGGGMAFAYKAFGEKVSFISGWAAFGAFVTIIPWEAIYVTDILSILIPGLKAGNPLYTVAGTDVYLTSIIIGLVFSVLLFAVNLKGMASSAMLQKVLCIGLVGAGILGMVAAVIKFDASNFLGPVTGNLYERVMNPATNELVGMHKSFFGGALAILASAPFFLAGFETIPQGVEEAGGDIANVGKTVVLSVGCACLFYAALLFAFGSAMPWQEFYGLPSPAASNMFKLVYSGGVGQTLYVIILLGAVAGLFTTWNGFFMASSKLLMSMGRASLVPRVLAKQTKSGAPINGLIVCLVLSIAGPFLGLGLIDPLTSFSGTAFVLSWT